MTIFYCSYGSCCCFSFFLFFSFFSFLQFIFFIHQIYNYYLYMFFIYIYIYIYVWFTLSCWSSWFCTVLLWLAYWNICILFFFLLFLLNMVVLHHCFRLSLWTVCWKSAIVGEINRNRNPINYNVFDSSEVGLDLFRTSSRSDFQQFRTKVSGRG